MSAASIVEQFADKKISLDQAIIQLENAEPVKLGIEYGNPDGDPNIADSVGFALSYAYMMDKISDDDYDALYDAIV